MYTLSTMYYNDLPLRVISGDELLFVLDDLIRLAGLEGMASQLLKTILRSRFGLDTQFKTREFKLPALKGYESRAAKHILVDKAAAYYILKESRVNCPEIGHGYDYNDYTDGLSNWFIKNFPLSEYEFAGYKALVNSITAPALGNDYINFIW